MKRINILLLLILLAPTLVFAQGGAEFTNPIGKNNVADVITDGIKWLLGIVAALFVLAIVWGGIKYITSFGDEKRVAGAKQIIFYAVFGFAIILLTATILNTIQQFFGIQ